METIHLQNKKIIATLKNGFLDGNKVNFMKNVELLKGNNHLGLLKTDGYINFLLVK